MRRSPRSRLFFFSLRSRPARSTLFPYTTLFRSPLGCSAHESQPCVAQPGQDLRESRCKGYSRADRKSTRLNSSHLGISYAVFCLKKKIEIKKREDKRYIYIART